MCCYIEGANNDYGLACTCLLSRFLEHIISYISLYTYKILTKIIKDSNN